MGCVYALVALGYTLVYGILELINFAHGDVFMLGGMFTITLRDDFSAFTTARASRPSDRVRDARPRDAPCGLINASIEFVAYRPLRHAPRLAPLITAIGVSFIIQDVGLAWKGPNYVTAPDVFPHARRCSRSAASTTAGTS